MHNFKLLDTNISITTNKITLDLIRSYNFETPGYICVIGLIEVLEGHINQKLKIAFNNSILNPLHSRIIEFIAKRKGYTDIKTLDPVWLLEQLLAKNVSHYFYGSSNTDLLKIQTKIEKEYPKAKVLGYKSPPYLGVDEIKDNETIKKDFETINELGPDIIWVGVGGVKQDILMYNHKKHLNRGLMVGVGAVYDCFIGNIKLRPDWIKRMGIGWLYYVVQQPKFRIQKLIRLFYLLTIKCLKNNFNFKTKL